MPKPRVLFIHTIPFYAGGEKFVFELIAYLHQQNLDVCLLARSSELVDRVHALGVFARSLSLVNLQRTMNPMRVLWFAVRVAVMLPALVDFIRRQQITLIYVNSWDAFLLSCLAAKITRRPIILHVHEIIAPRRITRMVFRLIGMWVTLMVGVSDAVVRHLRQELGVPTRRVRRIHNGIDLRQWPFRVPRSHKKKVVIATVGRIGGHKGQHIFVRSAQEILTLRRDVEFWIIGEAIESEWQVYRDRLVRDVQASRLEAHIRFMGWQRDIAAVLHPVDIVVVPSLFQDPFPYSVLEAMALGKPVVATQVGGIPEALVDGRTGFLVPPNDSVQLTRAIQRLIQDPVLRRQMGIAARKQIEKKFTLARSLSQIATTIDALSR